MRVGEARWDAFYVLRNDSRTTPLSATLTAVNAAGVVILNGVSAGVGGQRVYYLLNTTNIAAAASDYTLTYTVFLDNDEKLIIKRMVSVQ